MKRVHATLLLLAITGFACKGDDTSKANSGQEKAGENKAGTDSSETLSKETVEAALAKAVKASYGVDMTLECPDNNPADQPVACRGVLDGADVEIEYSGGAFVTKSGVITAEGLQKQLMAMAKAQNSSLDGIDCGPKKLYGTKPGLQIDCVLGPRTLKIEVNSDGKGIKVVSDEGSP